MDRLAVMLRVLLAPTVLVDEKGREYVVTGFEKDGRVAVLSPVAEPRRGRGRRVSPDGCVRIARLDGFTVKGA